MQIIQIRTQTGEKNKEQKKKSISNTYSNIMQIQTYTIGNYKYKYYANLTGKFSSRVEGALASTLNHDFNWKQLSEMLLCIFLLMFSKFI